MSKRRIGHSVTLAAAVAVIGAGTPPAVHATPRSSADDRNQQQWVGFMNGEHIAIGDLNKDGYGDIVVGHAAENYDSDYAQPQPTKGGAIGVVYGRPTGQNTSLKSVWTSQATAGVPGAAEADDGMGSSLSVADVDNDGYADVVTGVPGEDIGRVKDAGSVLILKGSAQALTGPGATVFSQESPGVPGILEIGDRFGEAVTIVGSTANERAQLAVGDPDENAGDGAAWVLHGVKTGPTTTGAIAFGPSGVGAPADTAQFGAALSHR